VACTEAGVDAVVCSRAGVEEAACSGVGVEDGSMLEDGRQRWRCPGHSDGGRWAVAKCLKILLSVMRDCAWPKIFRARAPNHRRGPITHVSHLTNGRRTL
jgi:hypothetical protein